MKKLNRLETLIYLILKHKPEINTGYKVNKFIQSTFPLTACSHQQVYRAIGKMDLVVRFQENEGKPASKHYQLKDDVDYIIDVSVADTDVLVYFGEMGLMSSRQEYLRKYVLTTEASLKKQEDKDNFWNSLCYKLIELEIITLFHHLNPQVK